MRLYYVYEETFTYDGAPIYQRASKYMLSEEEANAELQRMKAGRDRSYGVFHGVFHEDIDVFMSSIYIIEEAVENCHGCECGSQNRFQFWKRTEGVPAFLSKAAAEAALDVLDSSGQFRVTELPLE